MSMPPKRTSHRRFRPKKPLVMAGVVAVLVACVGFLTAQYLRPGLRELLIGVGLLTAWEVSRHVRRMALPTPQRQPLSWSGVTLGGLAALIAYVAVVPPAPGSAVSQENYALAKRINRLERELSRGYLESDTSPAPGEFVSWVKALPDGARHLQSPWGGPPQAAPVTVAPTDPVLRTAAALAGGAQPTPKGAVLGLGLRPGEAGFTRQTYGALVYDHDLKSGGFVLYGIGQAGDQAIVLAEVHSPIRRLASP